VQVILPKFDCIKYDLVHDITEAASFSFGGANVRVFRGTVEDLPTVFLEPDNGFFWVGCIYGRNDDAQRFGFFCGAAAEYLKNHSIHKPDVVHCHDWPTAPVAFGDIGGAKCDLMRAPCASCALMYTPQVPTHRCLAALLPMVR
jgi:starch synthase